MQVDTMTQEQVSHLRSLAECHNFVIHHAPDTGAVELALPSYSFLWSRDVIDEVRLDGGIVKLRINQFLAVNPGQALEVCCGRSNKAGYFQVSVCRELVRTTMRSLKESSSIVARSVASCWPVCFMPRPQACDGHFGPILRDIEKAASLRIQDGAWLQQQMRLFVELLLFEQSIKNRESGTGTTSMNLGGKLRNARKFLDTNFHRKIEIKSLARELAISRAHFIREFRRYYGDTPYQYLMNKRLDTALRLMTEEEVPVGVAFEKVGFNSGSVFYKAFRRRYKLTPSQARRTGVAMRS